MRISAHVTNERGPHVVRLRTDERSRELDIPPRESGFGSSANGGELLFLALARCYCNDVYREAAKPGIAVERVEVEVEGEFGGEGEGARSVSYRAKVRAGARANAVRALREHTDRVAADAVRHTCACERETA